MTNIFSKLKSLIVSNKTISLVLFFVFLGFITLNFNTSKRLENKMANNEITQINQERLKNIGTVAGEEIENPNLARVLADQSTESQPASSADKQPEIDESFIKKILRKFKFSSKNIKRHAIESDDIDSKSITSRTIKNNTIKGKDIKDGTIGGDKIKSDIDLTANSVTSNTITTTGDLTVGGTIYGTISGGWTPSGNLDMQNNLISNIGVAGTDFSGTGGLTLADALTVSSGGASITGDMSITGDLDVGSGGLFYDYITGYVGIGTAVPSDELEIAGSISTLSQSGGVEPGIGLFMYNGVDTTSSMPVLRTRNMGDGGTIAAPVAVSATDGALFQHIAAWMSQTYWQGGWKDTGRWAYLASYAWDHTETDMIGTEMVFGMTGTGADYDHVFRIGMDGKVVVNDHDETGHDRFTDAQFTVMGGDIEVFDASSLSGEILQTPLLDTACAASDATGWTSGSAGGSSSTFDCTNGEYDINGTGGGTAYIDQTTAQMNFIPVMGKRYKFSVTIANIPTSGAFGCGTNNEDIDYIRIGTQMADASQYGDTNTWVGDLDPATGTTQAPGGEPITYQQPNGWDTDGAQQKIFGNGTYSHVFTASSTITSFRIEIGTNNNCGPISIQSASLKEVQGGDLIVHGRTIGGISKLTLGAGATTFEVTNDMMEITGDGGANTIGTLTGCTAGSEVDLLFMDGNVTFTDTDAPNSANTINLSAAFTSGPHDFLTLKCNGIKWIEKSRSNN